MKPTKVSKQRNDASQDPQTNKKIPQRTSETNFVISYSIRTTWIYITIVLKKLHT